MNMTAKDYLQQAYNIDKSIKSKVEQIKVLDSLLQNVTSVISDMPGGSRNVHSKEDGIVKMLDLKTELKSECNRMMEIKQNIKRTIEMLEDERERIVLEKHYLANLTWSRVAKEMNYSKQHIYRIRDSGLKKISEIIKDVT